MKRRNFIKLSASASAMSLVPTEVFALYNSIGMTTCPDVSAKKIVLIQLSGANDGLNTIVPINQYDTYALLRPTIKLNQSGTNGIINLDSTLPLNNQVGLHPSLSAFKNLYDNGLMRILQGVGYANQNKSHFKSTDLWLTGGDGTTANNNIQSGWVGRFLENFYANFLTANFPLGIQLGSSDNSLGFHGEVEHGMSMNINGQDPSGFYSIINGLGGAAPTNIPNSEYGNLIQFILDNDTSTNIYAQTISAAFAAGSNSVTYPTTELADQLKTVAKFISGGLQTKVYLVKIGGFDTHNQQVANSTDTHLGDHANLLTELSQAISSFITDINNQNMGNDVVALTFSEFGRKAGENGSLGTDHGEISPMFAFGASLNPGISGTNVNLSEATSSNNFQIQTVQHDYRRIFGTVLQDWLGASSPTLDLTFYDNTNNIGFSNNKISNFINSQNTIAASCYTDSLLSSTEFDVKSDCIIYPNPADAYLHINVSENQNITNVNIYSFDSKLAAKYNNSLISSQMTINTSSLSNGIYLINVETNTNNFSKKIIIKH